MYIAHVVIERKVMVNDIKKNGVINNIEVFLFILEIYFLRFFSLDFDARKVFWNSNYIKSSKTETMIVI